MRGISRKTIDKFNKIRGIFGQEEISDREIKERVSNLRGYMEKKEVDAFLKYIRLEAVLLVIKCQR